jgi:predicted component of type VI protein secretion system
LRRTIAAFEPRLQQVRVTVEGSTEHERALQGRIEAVLVGDVASEQVSFPMVMRMKSGEVEVQGSA